MHETWQTRPRPQGAVESVYAEAKHLMPDVGGKAGTKEFTDAIVDAVTRGG